MIVGTDSHCFGPALERCKHNVEEVSGFYILCEIGDEVISGS